MLMALQTLKTAPLVPYEGVGMMPGGQSWIFGVVGCERARWERGKSARYFIAELVVK